MRRAVPTAALLLLSGCGGGTEPAAKPAAATGACAGTDRRFDAATAAFDAQSIGAHLFRDPATIRVDRLMRQGRWQIAWSSPAGIGPSVYVIRRNGAADEVVGEGRVAQARSRGQVAAWAMGIERHRPDPMPAALAGCLAAALVR